MLREHLAFLNRSPGHAVQRFDYICGVDGFSDIRRITEERIDILQVRIPAFADLRIFIVPDFRKLIYCHQCQLFGRGLINRLQAAGDDFVVLSRHLIQAAHLMDDTQLDMGGLREDAVYRIREAL